MADQTVRVQVTQEDIDAGVPNSDCGCPVALAIRRAIPDLEDIAVDWSFAGLVMAGSDEMFMSDLPVEATRAIDLFDAGKGMSPFEFDLPLPTLESANG